MRIVSIHETKAAKFKEAFKQQWKQVGEKRIFARSLWELRYARYLQMLLEHGEIKDWQHEPKTFWFEGIKRGVVSYKPDFLVVHKSGQEEWVEVKGYMDAKSATKLKRMKLYYPDIKIRLVDQTWFTKNVPALKAILPNWE